MGEKGKRAEAVVPEEVTRLLEERAKVQGWLERLVEHRGEATPDVFRKVETDYRERLEGVNGQLSSHRTDLEASLGRHRERVDDLEADREGRARELEEAKLRHAVGEYDDQTWERRREEGEAAIAGLDERLAEARSALQELSGVLAALPGGDGARGGGGREGREGAGPGGAAVATPEREPAAGPARTTAAREAEPRRRSGDRRPEERRSPEGGGGAALAGGAGVARADAEAAGPGTMDAGAMDAETMGAGTAGAEAAEPETAEADGAPVSEAEGDDSFADEDRHRTDADFMDELEFLESLSLEDAERFDAVSAMLEGEEEEESGSGEEERS